MFGDRQRQKQLNCLRGQQLQPDALYHDRPIRYFKLHNSGAAIIHFLIEDAMGGHTVWDGGPALVAGSEDTIDLSSTPGIDSTKKYRFGAFVEAGKNATDDNPHRVDFNSDLVGVWSWSGTTIVGSKVTFEGYEHYHERPSADAQVLRLMARVDVARCQGNTVGGKGLREAGILTRGVSEATVGNYDGQRTFVNKATAMMTLRGSKLEYGLAGEVLDRGGEWDPNPVVGTTIFWRKLKNLDRFSGLRSKYPGS